MPKPNFSRAFIVGAYNPNGGTYMAYHLGKILHCDFDVEAIAVNVSNERIDNGVYNYDLQMPEVPVGSLNRTITDDDILIVNPSFSNQLFGWRLAGFKICYVQGFSTYTILDRKFDHYVAVSKFVQDFLRAVYGIEVPLIPAFINLDRIPNTIDWPLRPEFAILPYRKGLEEIWNESYQRLRELVQARLSSVVFEDPIFGEHYVPQIELFNLIGKYRYLLMLSAAEGFPLVPLESMAVGTVVVGYDGFGGRHYMRSGENCLVAPYPEIEQIAELLIDAMNAPAKGLAMSERARATASQYSYEAFRKRWREEFAKILGI